jgi:hypothetical protein
MLIYSPLNLLILIERAQQILKNCSFLTKFPAEISKVLIHINIYQIPGTFFGNGDSKFCRELENGLCVKR